MKLKTPLFLSFLIVINVIVSAEKPYFQQQVNNTINVILDDENHIINAQIEIEYINNSPDTLNFIYIHLWPNAYSSNKTAFAKQSLKNGKKDFYFATDNERGYIDSLDFKINSISANWQLDDLNPDIAKLLLNSPLLPGDTIFINTPFRVKFPDSSFSRLGHNGQAYYATQWYPKPAVYDKFGWHPMPYLFNGEFYSEFGNFDVHITLPDNYIVAASGELLTQSVRQKLDSIADVCHNILKDYNLPDNYDFPESSQSYKTLHFRIENAHDFAWVADKRFYVISTSIQLKSTGRTVSGYGFFIENSPIWEHSAGYINRVIKYMSDLVGEYPYNSFSAVQTLKSGGANMEYPGLTTIGDKLDGFQLDRVIAHEAIHNWFYGILAFNERQHPWLDEGFTSYYDHRYSYEYYTNLSFIGGLANTIIGDYFDLSHYPYIKQAEISVIALQRLNIDLPASLHSTELDMINYFAMVYSKANMSINHLEKYLGTDEFDRIVKQFYNEWKFKHPTPSDLRTIFEKESDKNLSWFFDDLIGSTKLADYSIKKVKKDYSNYYITIKNKGEINSPVPISALLNNEIIHTVWVEGFSGSREIEFPGGNYDRFTIDPNYYTLDFNRDNNNYFIGKIFPKINPLHLQPYFSIENPLKTQIFASPVIGWNNSSGLMPGLAFYNQVVPFNSNELFAMPMYGFDNNRLQGEAWAYKTFFNRKSDGLHAIRAGISLKSYGTASVYEDNDYFIRIQPSLKITFNNSAAVSDLTNYITIRSIFIDRDNPIKLFNQPTEEKRLKYSVYELSYHQYQNHTITKYEINASLQLGENLIKAWGDYRYSFIYDKSGKEFKVRLFAGKFFRSPDYSDPVDYRFRLGNHLGFHDYLYDNTYLSRGYYGNSFLYNQTYQKDGAFRIITPVGQTYNWLAACNLTLDIPYMPMSLFADVGIYDDAHNYSKYPPYVAGIQIEPIKDFISIYLPVFISPEIAHAANLSTVNYLQKISFTIRFDKLNLFEQLKAITSYLY
ncbi:MAG: M1 family metallopeptidase [Bacteroidetes bacterium]|nr:M1 family metallopeptidase [Bacteroidota bacterium]